MKEIDLVLSGSGVRLGVHYGAILALKKKYNITRIAGVSGGAIIAAAYACYYPFEDIWHIIKHINFNKLLTDGKFTSPIRLICKHGLYLGKRFENFIDKEITHGIKLAEVPGLNIIVTDLTYKKNRILSYAHGYGNMKVSQAVRMSMSVPIYWIPKYLNINNTKAIIIDGGISNNYPIDIFDDNKRQTIGISLYTKKPKSYKLKIFTYFRDIIDTMLMSNEREHIEDAYWAKTIKIDTDDIRPFDLDIKSKQIDDLIKKGYFETEKILEKKFIGEIK